MYWSIELTSSMRMPSLFFNLYTFLYVQHKLNCACKKVEIMWCNYISCSAKAWYEKFQVKNHFKTLNEINILHDIKIYILNKWDKFIFSLYFPLNCKNYKLYIFCFYMNFIIRFINMFKAFCKLLLQGWKRKRLYKFDDEY